MTNGGKREPMKLVYKVGFNDDGSIEALQLDFHMDGRSTSTSMALEGCINTTSVPTYSGEVHLLSRTRCIRAQRCSTCTVTDFIFLNIEAKKWVYHQPTSRPNHRRPRVRSTPLVSFFWRVWKGFGLWEWRSVAFLYCDCCLTPLEREILSTHERITRCRASTQHI